MLNPLKALGALGDMNKLRSQAAQMQKELSKEMIRVEQDGVVIEMSGDQKIHRVEIDGQEERRVARAVEEAIRKTQEVAARKLASMSGMFGQKKFKIRNPKHEIRNNIKIQNNKFKTFRILKLEY